MPETIDTAEAGRRGDDVRSDCWVRITLTDTHKIDVRLKTKVESMYGQSIRALTHDVLSAFGVASASVEIEDAGALPFVLMARLEAAVRRLGMDAGAGALPEFEPHAQQPTQRDRFRRSRLYLPGNEPKFMLNAGLHQPDGVILDLEDSVALSVKDEARVLVRNALRSIDFKGSERMVRINQGDRGLQDLGFIIPHNVHVVLIPKVEVPDQVRAVDQKIAELLKAHGIDTETTASDHQPVWVELVWQ
jgi:citrate lyase subunit beta/citryl-CoA lyase